MVHASCLQARISISPNSAKEEKKGDKFCQKRFAWNALLVLVLLVSMTIWTHSSWRCPEENWRVDTPMFKMKNGFSLKGSRSSLSLCLRQVNLTSRQHLRHLTTRWQLLSHSFPLGLLDRCRAASTGGAPDLHHPLPTRHWTSSSGHTSARRHGIYRQNVLPNSNSN